MGHMELINEPSIFAQMVDKLRNKTEEELKMIYLQLFSEELSDEWKTITMKSDFKNATEDDIVNAIQRNRYKGKDV
jgi:hypothetical protein